MPIPAPLLQSLAGIPGYDREAFAAVHAHGEQVTSVRINPGKWKKDTVSTFFPGAAPVPWTGLGYYLPARPSFTFDPLFHAGCYYVQEASSMFLEQALRQHTDSTRPLRVLDLCAAPGGKSTHIHSLITADSLLVSNEVIRSRAMVLKDNIIKWGCANVVVTQNDPRDFKALEHFFDVIVVDAPCSGSGLFRREPEAIGEWSEANVQLCSQRQQRILADVLPALKENGLLVYSTCSYSREEDEDICNWLQQDCALQPVPLTVPGDWQIAESAGGYRFWPHRLNGEGFFLACFRQPRSQETTAIKIKKQPPLLSNREHEWVAHWMQTEGKLCIRHQDTVYAWPANQFREFSYLLERMNVVYSGTRAGELMRDKLIPDHALAMSTLVHPPIPVLPVSRENAIRYLQRKEMEVSPAGRGWQLVSYTGHPLGWINVLPGRINNYYPKGLRILKEG